MDDCNEAAMVAWLRVKADLTFASAEQEQREYLHFRTGYSRGALFELRRHRKELADLRRRLAALERNRKDNP